MNLLFTNQELDEQIKQVKKYIRLSMNGVTADSMSENGINYKSNLGVTIPRIKEIAGYFNANADLSRRLWLLGGRETMIVALLLFPQHKFDIKEAEYFIKGITNIDIAEQTAMLLFSKSENAIDIAMKCLSSENEFVIVCGLLCLSRIYNNISSENINRVTNKIFEQLPTENFHIYKSAATALSRFCRISQETAKEIRLRINNILSSNDDKSLHFTRDIIDQEIIFLNYSI